MNPHNSNPDNETSISELTIAPDGRIYVFGASWQVLELLEDLKLGDATLKRRVEHLRASRYRENSTVSSEISANKAAQVKNPESLRRTV